MFSKKPRPTLPAPWNRRKQPQPSSSILSRPGTMGSWPPGIISWVELRIWEIYFTLSIVRKLKKIKLKNELKILSSLGKIDGWQCSFLVVTEGYNRYTHLTKWNEKINIEIRFRRILLNLLEKKLLLSTTDSNRSMADSCGQIVI